MTRAGHFAASTCPRPSGLPGDRGSMSRVRKPPVPWLPALAALLLGACVAVPDGPAPGPAPAPPAPTEAVDAAHAERFERTWRERGREAARRGAWAEAQEAAEVLLLWRPHDESAQAALAEARGQIERLLPERVARAQASRRRGELDAAAGQWLAVLLLSPRHAEAAQALREIERERARRGALGRGVKEAPRDMAPAPRPAGRAATAAAAAAPRDAAGPRAAGAVDPADAEHLALLLRQGEWDEAQALATRAPAAAAMRRRLADLFVKLAEPLPLDDPGAADAVRRALVLAPGHPGALGWQRRAREAQAGGRR